MLEIILKTVKEVIYYIIIFLDNKVIHSKSSSNGNLNLN
jgi:hypothetical protein